MNKNPDGTCIRNDDGSVSHYDKNKILTAVTHNTTLTGRPKSDEMGYGPNAGKTFFGPKGGTDKSHK